MYVVLKFSLMSRPVTYKLHFLRNIYLALILHILMLGSWTKYDYPNIFTIYAINLEFVYKCKLCILAFNVVCYRPDKNIFLYIFL